MESVKKDEEEAVNGGDCDESEAKRPRLEEMPDELGYQEEMVNEPKEEIAEQPPAENNIQSEDTEQTFEEAPETVNNEPAGQEEPSKGDFQKPHKELQELPVEEVSQQGDVFSVEQQPASEPQTILRKMEVPNTEADAGGSPSLMARGFNTVQCSGAGEQIQIQEPNEKVGLIIRNINKAGRLIKDVVAKADAEGFPSLVVRGFKTVEYSTGVQIQIQVPNERVGLIIGKGGEIIKNLQTRSGARIQLIPQHIPDGDQSKERMVRVTGDKKQVEMAREMIIQVMNQETSMLKRKLLEVFAALRFAAGWRTNYAYQLVEVAATDKWEDGWGYDNQVEAAPEPTPVYNWDIPPPSCSCARNDVWNKDKDEEFDNRRLQLSFFDNFPNQVSYDDNWAS